MNETISTLLLNYVAPLFVDYLVYGPWKDAAQSLGWPSTVMFPEAARLPTFFGTRVHLGLFLGLGLVLGAHFILSRTRWGFYLDVLRSSPTLARRAGLGFGAAALMVMAAGGACAGLAGIAEASVLEGRLQSGVGANAGYSGFLVAWLARGRLPLLAPLGVLVAGLAASGDNLQLAADLPSATTYVMQGLLFRGGADRGRPARPRGRSDVSAAAIVLSGFLGAALRSATPLLWTLLGETVTQRAGIVNLGVEGEMLVGAAAAFGVTAHTGNPWLGLVAGGAAGAALSLGHSLLCLRFRANQFASGLSIWMIGFGVSAYWGAPLVGHRSRGLGR